MVNVSSAYYFLRGGEGSGGSGGFTGSEWKQKINDSTDDGTGMGMVRSGWEVFLSILI
jgi:hypothetical protein